MSFPSSPANGATAVINGVLYTYDSTEKSWTRTSQGQSNSNIVFTNNAQTITGIKTFSANVIVSGLSANGSVGTAGQVLTSDGANTYWAAAASGSKLEMFTADGTWTKPTSGTFAKITAVGSGGGGATAAAANPAGGGLGGDVVTAVIPLASLGATETITIGAAGTGATAAATNGVSGSAVSFGTHVIAAGGAGGETGSLGNIAYTGTASAVATGTAQLSSTGLLFSAYGGDKAAGASAAASGVSNIIGKGGSSSSAGAGSVGTGYGAGGGAGVTAGGNGTKGFITVEVF